MPVDYVADAVLALAGRERTTYHLTAGERTSSVGELMDLASDVPRRPAPRTLPPRLYRRAIHPLLVRTGSQARRRALRRSEAFFPYFEMAVRYDNTRTREALRGQRIEAPAAALLLRPPDRLRPGRRLGPQLAPEARGSAETQVRPIRY